jgi:TonB family protein
MYGVQKDRSTFRRALEISLLIHLLLIFLIVPQLHEVWPASDEAVSRLIPVQELQAQQQQQKPLEFEFVDLAEEREETPVSPDVPLSDLDRRAHGGEGEAASRPSSQGNTWQLIQSQGSDAAQLSQPQQPMPPSEQVYPQREQPYPEPTEGRESAEREQEEGYGEEQTEPKVLLPPPGSWALPPEPSMSENPDRDGGTVDAGGLSFDTQWYDWGPYAKAMIRKIRRNWKIPEIARLGVAGVVKIRFFIERDGTVTGLQIIDESGKPPMDFAARDAIAISSPFAPLPTDLTAVEREGVTITFYYNQRPPDRGGY